MKTMNIDNRYRVQAVKGKRSMGGHWVRLWESRECLYF